MLSAGGQQRRSQIGQNIQITTNAAAKRGGMEAQPFGTAGLRRWCEGCTWKSRKT